MKNRKGLRIFNNLLRGILTWYFYYSIINNYDYILIVSCLCFLVWGILGYIEGIFDGIEMKKADKENKL